MPQLTEVRAVLATVGCLMVLGVAANVLGARAGFGVGVLVAAAASLTFMVNRLETIGVVVVPVLLMAIVFL